MREKARAAALSFWRYFHEVRTKNLKAFLLGARRAGVCILALVVLLSGVSIPAYADFGGTDSTNLANLTTYTRSIWDYIRVTLQNHLSNIYSRLGTMVTHLQSIANNTSASSSRLLDISNRLTELYNLLVSRSSSAGPSFSPDARPLPFYGPIRDGTYYITSEGYLVLNEQPLTNSVGGYGQHWLFTGSLSGKGKLRFRLPVVPPAGVPVTVNLYIGRVGSREGIPTSFEFSLEEPIVPSDYEVYPSMVRVMGNAAMFSGSSRLLGNWYSYTFTPSREFESFSCIALTGNFSGSGTLYFSASIVVGSGSESQGIYDDVDDKFQESVNPGQDEANQQLQDSVGQLEDFDNSVFTDVSQYTSQLDFGLGDWSEAAAGISYIGSIFMLVWDNSPTQVIVLSLMVGLCLLILGRGPRVAGEVRRHEERASRRKKGG